MAAVKGTGEPFSQDSITFGLSPKTLAKPIGDNPSVVNTNDNSPTDMCGIELIGVFG